MSVAGIVLAAGASERMGTPKLLLPCEGGTVLTATVAAFTDAGLDRVVVVSGHWATEIERSLESCEVDIVRNPDPDRCRRIRVCPGRSADASNWRRG